VWETETDDYTRASPRISPEKYKKQKNRELETGTDREQRESDRK
jgi:hypothetical protein